MHRVRNIVDQIVHHGHVQPSWIGVQLQDLTPELAFHFGTSPGAGVLINGVDEASPAAKAGLKRGQIIVKAANTTITNAAAFTLATKGLAAGDTLSLRIVENAGKSRRVTLTLSAVPTELIEAFSWRGLGISVDEHPAGVAIVVVKVRPDSPAAQIGIQRGDAIAGIGGRAVEDVGAFQRALAALRNSNNVLLSVVRGRRLYRVTVPVAR